jgi:hypothetical protein
MAMPARLKSAYFYGFVVRLCLISIAIAGVVSWVIHDNFWDVLAEIAFVVILLEILKIPSVHRPLAKIRTGLGLKSK